MVSLSNSSDIHYIDCTNEALNQGSSTFFMKSPLFKKCWSESPPIKTITVLSFESFPEIYLRSF